MKDDFFFLHQSFDENTFQTEVEIILTQTDSLFEGELGRLLKERLNLPVKYYPLFKDCRQYLTQTTSLFCLIAEKDSKENTDITDNIKQLKRECPDMTVIVLHRLQRENPTVVEEGIRYLKTPLDFEKLLSSIHQALQEDLGIILPGKKQQESDLKNLEGHMIQGMIAVSLPMRNILGNVKKNIGKNCPILITGSPGTGKKLLAKTIHQLCPQKNKPLVRFDAKKISFDLLTNKLSKDSTVIIDNIHQMPQDMQRRLLNFFERTRDLAMGRMIAICDDLDAWKNSEKLLEDFQDFFKFSYNLPVLSKRAEDILPLISLFIYRFSFGRDKWEFTQDALQTLLHYSWPGNVQELINFVEKMAALKKSSVVGLADLPTKYTLSLPMTIPQGGIDLKNVINAIELSFIDQALQKTQGNKQQASKLLGIKRTTLIEKMKKRKRQNERELPVD